MTCLPKTPSLASPDLSLLLRAICLASLGAIAINAIAAAAAYAAASRLGGWVDPALADAATARPLVNADLHAVLVAAALEDMARIYALAGAVATVTTAIVFVGGVAAMARLARESLRRGIVLRWDSRLETPMTAWTPDSRRPPPIPFFLLGVAMAILVPAVLAGRTHDMAVVDSPWLWFHVATPLVVPPLCLILLFACLGMLLFAVVFKRMRTKALVVKK